MVGRYRLGVDIGGTFTDVMVADEAGTVDRDPEDALGAGRARGGHFQRPG